jgi:CHAT domain-containing protein
VTIIEDLRDQTAGSADEARSFLRNKLSPYRGLARLDLARGDIGSAFQWTERAKSRALADVLSGGHVTATKSMTAADKEDENRLRRNLAAWNERFSRAKESDLPRVRTQLDAARMDFAAFENALYARHAELRTNRARMEPVSPPALAALLPQRSVFLGYTVTERETWLFLIAKTGRPRFYRIRAGVKDLSQRVENYRQKLANHDLGIRSDARELFALLLAPVSEEIRRADLLIVAPDGPLWQVPFQALESSDGRPLIASSALTYTPSATVLAGILKHRASAPPLRDRRMLLMSYGVEGADEETREIAQLYGNTRADVLTGAAARESVFKSRAAGYGAIHIAAHGRFDDTSPMYSGISLAKDGDEDGRLEAWELMNMDLHASLVVLSACETARGAINPGEGLIGMTWALFVAGAPATVAGNWEVDSKATRELMTGLHRRLRDGLSPAAALRDSALKLMAQPAYRHPFYWASFSVFGAGF